MLGDLRFKAFLVNRLGHRRQRQTRGKICNLLRQTRDPRLGIGDGINVVLKDDLSRRMREAHRRQPAPTNTGPALLAGMDPAVASRKP